jgi:UDP-glucose 4-epimerase
MKLLITGGSGFIGRNLAEGLAGEFEVLSPTHGELELLDTQAVERFFRENEVEVVIHSATRPGHRKVKDTSDLVSCNTRMLLNLIRNSGRYRRMILLTSGAVYDSRHYIPRMKEEYFDTHVPADDAGFSKYVCSKISELSGKVVELRPFGVFGKYEDWQIRFISNMICKALYGLPLTMKQNRGFDYIYIDDLVRVIRYFIDHDSRYKAYNVTPDCSVELESLARMVLEIHGKPLGIVVDQPGMGPEYTGDNSRLRQEIDGLSFTDHREAVHRLYRWYEANLHSIEREKLLIDI